jgi:hypothetical protein
MSTEGGLRALRHTTAVCVAIAAMLPACSPAPRAAENGAVDAPSLDSLRAVVLQLIGEPTATSLAQCRLMPAGEKPCGGPRSYLVYSMETTDSTALARAELGDDFRYG